MTIQNILNHKCRDVRVIRPSAPVKTAADHMRAFGVASLVAKSGDTVMGIVSERDIVGAVSRFGEPALSKPVKDILPKTIVTIAPGDSVKRAMRLMTLHHVRHLAVMEGGTLVGIVSIGDVVKHRLEDLETESNVLRDAYIAAH
jgi:CBS domain-containing protein